MRQQRGPDRRRNHSGRSAGLPERRCGAERRKLQLTDESIAEVEAHLAALASSYLEGSEDEGSGWDKLIIPLN